MAEFVPVSEAKAKLTQLLRDSAEQDVVLMRHGHPAAVLMSAGRHAELVEALEDAEDRLAVYESAGEPAVPLDVLFAETGAA
ncbi:MAG: type II toxin-antitoxin system Phd/YefM family antitoxin [Actinobacteria bacterium]|nr:type II toxin-antitoxin system Phd/YefM family antitoxin [Actinomycetota bacterium]